MNAECSAWPSPRDDVVFAYAPHMLTDREYVLREIPREPGQVIELYPGERAIYCGATGSTFVIARERKRRWWRR